LANLVRPERRGSTAGCLAQDDEIREELAVVPTALAVVALEVRID
jgi:hypothetical protein